MTNQNKAMQKDLYEFIVCELKAYKMNKAVYESLLIENEIVISAQVISDMPRSNTNKFSSITENQALNHPPSHVLKLEIMRVENWLKALHDDERYMIESFYINNKTYNSIISGWRVEQSIEFWKRKRISAINKIFEIEKCSIEKRMAV
jgi:hypothetical protein